MTTAVIIIGILGIIGLAVIYREAIAMIDAATGFGGDSDDAQAEWEEEEAANERDILKEIEQWREER